MASNSGEQKFTDFDLQDAILDALGKKGIHSPTPIQHQAIPLALQGKDLIGIAQTGTGKTFSFGLPMLEQLSQGKKRGLIVLPTRELAYQVEEELRPFADALRIRTTVFVGGASMRQQIQSLKRNPRILIATPGRLSDHLRQKTVTLQEVEVLVLDEADRMLDMGFKPQIDHILSFVPKERQTLLFSATMPQNIVQLATSQMQMPLRIEIAPESTTASTVEQELIVVRQQEKRTLLELLLNEHEGQVLVFSRTKHGAKKLTKALNDANFSAAEIHANRSLVQRRAALDGFKKGKYRVLIATDIASRGIDVTGLDLVVNYDLPDDAADYVHRIGRTGRSGRSGRAISFATPTQAKHIREIEKLIRSPIKRRTHEALPEVELEKDAPPRRRSFGGKRRGFRRR